MSNNEKRDTARHYFGLDSNDNLVSMFCLFASLVERDNLADAKGKLPKIRQYPTVKIGRLVVHEDHRKNTYGTQTIAKAIEIFIDISKKIGAIGITVDAKKGVDGFYKRFGFEELKPGESEETIPLILYAYVIRNRNPSSFEDPV